MSKSPKALTILVMGGREITDTVLALHEKGHEVFTDAGMTALRQFDLILGPACCRFLPGMEPFLDAIIKGVRAAKEKEKKP